MRATTDEIRALLRRLDGEPADALESQAIECKTWDPGPERLREQVRTIREAVVALANANGGTLVLGVRDRQRTRGAALVGVGALDADLLRKAIYDGTDPHILVDAEDLREPEARLLLLHVPRGIGVHTTTEGVARIRVGKDSLPLTGSMMTSRLLASADADRTAMPVPGAGPGDLDIDEVRRFQTTLATEGRNPELARLDPSALLENLGLVRSGQPSLAAVLLLGRRAALSRWVPQHEVLFLRYPGRSSYDVRHSLRGPLLSALHHLQQLLDAHAHLTSVAAGGLSELTVPDLSWWVAREAVLNALVHRDYFLNQSVYVELRPGRVEVTSPGPFLGGVTPDNILRHPPVRRNPLLADALDQAGLVNRAGMGVDRIYEELLSLGKGMPRYEADESTVRLTLPTTTHAGFARFVARERRGERPLLLDHLIVLRAVVDRGELDLKFAAVALQEGEDDAAEVLAALRRRGYLTPRGRGRGTKYRLVPALAADMFREGPPSAAGLPLDDEAARARVLAELTARGRLTNGGARHLTGWSRTRTLRLMLALRDEGLAEAVGRGRAAHYVPGAALETS